MSDPEPPSRAAHIFAIRHGTLRSSMSLTPREHP